jgi:hypothetical protein
MSISRSFDRLRTGLQIGHELTIYFEKIVRNFTRYHKYTLGSELREKSREIVGLIIKANSTVEKLPGEENGD